MPTVHSKTVQVGLSTCPSTQSQPHATLCITAYEKLGVNMFGDPGWEKQSILAFKLRTR